MPFIPHTDEDIKEMLKTIGIDNIETLFDEIPDSLRKNVSLDDIPSGVSEMELGKAMRVRARQDGDLLCFIGAGAYEHHIPAAVWEVTTRGEFYTAYTPYQAEASQGTLQLIYEFQTMMASLMALEVSNASLYDGATALAEAILMSVRLAGKKQYSVLMPRSIHPHYRDTVRAIVGQQDIKLIEVPYQKESGKIDISALNKLCNEDIAALIIGQPNFFGVLEDVDQLTDWAREKGILSVAVVNPTAMALLKPPGQWGQEGVDIACGEGQPLGIPLASGGPYYGFLCCKKAHVRQMPGRIVGRTVDLNGKQGFVLTLQAREQHIRRAKATSNICTNQGLMVTASTIYMSLMGPEGLRRIAILSHERTREMMQVLSAIPGVDVVFPSPFFHEIVLRINRSADDVLHELAKHKIQAGFSLKKAYPELGECILICATETKTSEEIQLLAQSLSDALSGDVFKGGKVACQA